MTYIPRIIIDCVMLGVDMAIEFDAETTKVVAAGRAAWAKLKRDETWADWVAVGRAISAGRAAVMRYLRTNVAAGRQWSEYFGGWLRDNGFDEIDKSVRARLEKCMDHLPEIEAWRETIGVDKRQQWNHPNTIWRHFSTKHGIAAKGPWPKSGKGADQAIAELQQSVDDLRQRVGGPGLELFDLSTPELIEESARNFIEIYGLEEAASFATALRTLTQPPQVAASDPAIAIPSRGLLGALQGSGGGLPLPPR
jgi:hypothetical protein